ncbi:glycosyltransferase [Sedimentibacter hydroxybenzoicus DSM 7310]|uniref:Glycosyltransferase n=1 Tax=Sedimentibacter hydroxybenzoicus DSM 7310 TaxID=1123245 RepID=A0A974BJN4_SEDHY|nr:glycosyltransferase [Sedimentibacter hydroxybenzoicus]NYB74505.1 glycosyltransferase [Sedimentibacter hydroxybenzoicus DSM 7310]
MEAKYSVLMSIYIKEKPEYFVESLESMINQTLKPDEIVIVKDGELTDELEDVIDCYIDKYPKLFNIVSLKENIGLGRALDEGIRHSRNELVARMDTDDISLPERCELQIKQFINNPDLCIVGTMIDEFYDSPSNIISSRIVPTTNDEIYKFMKRRSPFNHPTVMYKKSEVIRCGGYGKMRRKQDLDLFSRMINNGCIAQNINQSLLLFRSNEDNFKRRKSWSYCKSYINVQFEIWKRGHCSIEDLVFVTIGQLVIFLVPIRFLKKILNKYLRSTKN